MKCLLCLVRSGIFQTIYEPRVTNLAATRNARAPQSVVSRTRSVSAQRTSLRPFEYPHTPPPSVPASAADSLRQEEDQSALPAPDSIVHGVAAVLPALPPIVAPAHIRESYRAFQSAVPSGLVPAVSASCCQREIAADPADHAHMPLQWNTPLQ